jgi:hypothetical protein
VILVDVGPEGAAEREAARLREPPAPQGAVLVAISPARQGGGSGAGGFDHSLGKPVAPDALNALLARLGPAERAEG